MSQDRDLPPDLSPPGATIKTDNIRARKIAALVPNGITLGALLCGLTAIRLSGEGQFALAMAAIFAAALLDVVDGFAARRLAAESEIGAELDSLADFLNFGVAPALLLYDSHLYLLGSAGWLVAATYAAATGLRLARFNVQSKNKWQGTSKKWFLGLPSTGAAVTILAADKAASLWLHAEQIPPIIAGAAIAASALMLSTLRVPSLSALFTGADPNQ